MNYYVEVGWADLDVDQERSYFSIGPFRSRKVADGVCAQVERVLDREQKIADEVGNGTLIVGAMVRPFYTKTEVLTALCAWIKEYQEPEEPSDEAH